jgi:hypothetical protein
MNRYADKYPQVRDPNLMAKMVPVETFLSGVKFASTGGKPPAAGGLGVPPGTQPPTISTPKSAPESQRGFFIGPIKPLPGADKGVTPESGGVGGGIRF